MTWFLLGSATLAQAGFTIVGTRVIYHEAEGEATVHLRRTAGEQPVLLQIWLDDGSPDAKPGAQDLPFVLMPTVSRVDPGQAQVIRILRARNDLPTDRESLLFFNALEVPLARAMPTQADENRLQLAMQARMKFFYRPAGLTASPTQVADLLRFTLDPKTEAGKLHLRIHNPTPYHITVPNLALHAEHAAPDAVALAKFQETGIAPMVAPFGDLAVDLHVLAPNTTATQLVRSPAAQTQVRYTVINDQGGVNAKQQRLSNAS